MAVTVSCTDGRNSNAVRVDYGDGEYIQYEICVKQGASIGGWVIGGSSEDPKVILGKAHDVSASCRRTDWAKSAAPWLGLHFHTITLTFAEARKYAVKASVRNANGTVKKWIRDCAYTGTKETDHKEITIVIEVV